MIIDRRRLLGGLSASVLVSRVAHSAVMTDAAGRAVTIPGKVERIFPAGPPAAILLYTLAPELLLGWTRSPQPGQCAFLGPGACDKPEVGRLTGRGNTTNLEVLPPATSKPDLVLDVGTINDTYISLATACRSRLASLTLCSMAASTLSCRSIAKLGELTHRPDQAEALARYADETIKTIKSRIDTVSEAQRPRVYYGRGPNGLETGLGGSINVETIEFLGAHNVAAERRGGLATVSVEQVLAWNPEVIITIEPAFATTVRTDPVWAPIKAVQTSRIYLSPRLPFGRGRFPAFGEQADRFVVARQGALPRQIPRGFASADPRVLPALLSHDSKRRPDRQCAQWPRLIFCPDGPLLRARIADRLRCSDRGASPRIFARPLPGWNRRSVRDHCRENRRPPIRRPGRSGECTFSSARPTRSNCSIGRRRIGCRGHRFPGIVPQSASVARLARGFVWGGSGRCPRYLSLAWCFRCSGALAFIGGLAAVVAVYLIGSTVRARDPILVLVLTGVVIGALLGAGVGLVKYVADPYNQLPAMTFWLLGSLAAASAADLIPLFSPVALGILILLALRWRMNVLSLPDEEARA